MNSLQSTVPEHSIDSRGWWNVTFIPRDMGRTWSEFFLDETGFGIKNDDLVLFEITINNTVLFGTVGIFLIGVSSFLLIA